MRLGMAVLLCLMVAASPAFAQSALKRSSPYALWKHGPLTDETFFPIAVWLQQPRYAPHYRAAGINLYVGLWKGPTEEQLAELARHDMPVICHQNEVGLRHANGKTIVGWMHGDEPDNAQPLPKGQKGWGPPVRPEVIIAGYERIRAADQSRPVLLNLGQGVAYDNYIGRGVRRRHLEDCPEYVKGADIVSFDIYPVVHRNATIAGKLWYVPKGVLRLRKWSGKRRIVWNVIECTRIRGKRAATPHEIRAEVWMSLIHGSTGIIYFVHTWKPKFDARALLHDPVNLPAVTAINRRIHQLAPVLNSPTIKDGATMSSSNPDCPVAFMVKCHRGATYIFAVAMRDLETRVTFNVLGLKQVATAEVIDEGRNIPVRGRKFTDAFKGYEVHLYRIR